jgi:hypothetical protein
MSDNKSRWGFTAYKRIDIHDPSGVRQGSQSLGMTPEQLKEVVARVGTSAQKVQESLRKL